MMKLRQRLLVALCLVVLCCFPTRAAQMTRDHITLVDTPSFQFSLPETYTIVEMETNSPESSTVVVFLPRIEERVTSEADMPFMVITDCTAAECTAELQEMLARDKDPLATCLSAHHLLAAHRLSIAYNDTTASVYVAFYYDQNNVFHGIRIFVKDELAHTEEVAEAMDVVLRTIQFKNFSSAPSCL